MYTIYALILTLCINEQCNQTIPETFYTLEDCVGALQEIDQTYGQDTGSMFVCEKLEE
jgi:hypothetical protein